MQLDKMLWTIIFPLILVLGFWNQVSKSSPSNKVQSHHNMSISKKQISLNAFERKIAQRFMISIRYFCEDDSLHQLYCKQPVTRLPKMLADLIKETEVGGVVLFSENIESHQQTIELTNDLQFAASQSNGQRPLFIGIDQEGGRVVRMPRDTSTAFSGNMAIAATYPKYNDYYAKQVARIIGQELFALGINLNFAPDIDVNNNPDNPVINSRSFGEQPNVVSKLGIAMLNAFQQQNIIATLKHFPGHGNTNVDSHTGLPSVNYDEKTIYQTDLLPFQNAIDNAEPGMIMTAHIQYPNLDNSTLTTKYGEEIIKPATMSYKLLTELLRKKMGFKGVVITDAMNMAGISHHFEAVEATATSLMAGADIILMPYKISKKQDVEGFKQFVRSVSNSLLQQDNAKQIVLESLNRISRLKKKYQITMIKQKFLDQHSLIKKTINASLLLANQSSRMIQNKLTFDSITMLKNKSNNLLKESGEQLHIIVQDTQQLTVVTQALNYYWPMVNNKTLRLTHTLLSKYEKKKTELNISQSDTVILFFSARRESAVVKGEIDDLAVDIKLSEKNELERLSFIHSSLGYARGKNKQVFIAGMHSPYEMKQFLPVADAVLVAYDANIYKDKQSKKLVGITYDASIAVLLGIEQAKGILPVTL